MAMPPAITVAVTPSSGASPAAASSTTPPTTPFTVESPTVTFDPPPHPAKPVPTINQATNFFIRAPPMGSRSKIRNHDRGPPAGAEQDHLFRRPQPGARTRRD